MSQVGVIVTIETAYLWQPAVGNEQVPAGLNIVTWLFVHTFPSISLYFCLSDLRLYVHSKRSKDEEDSLSKLESDFFLGYYYDIRKQQD